MEEFPLDKQDPSQINYDLTDNDDGSYTVKYKVDQPCHVDVEVYFQDENNNFVPVRGFPFSCQFLEDQKENQNEMDGPNILNYVQNSLEQIGTFIDTAKENIDIRHKNITEDVN